MLANSALRVLAGVRFATVSIRVVRQTKKLLCPRSARIWRFVGLKIYSPNINVRFVARACSDILGLDHEPLSPLSWDSWGTSTWFQVLLLKDSSGSTRYSDSSLLSCFPWQTTGVDTLSPWLPEGPVSFMSVSSFMWSNVWELGTRGIRWLWKFGEQELSTQGIWILWIFRN